MVRRLLSKKTLILTGIVLVLAVVIFYTEENWRGRRAWENYRAAAEKRGAKLFLKDFIPADIPDSENYAAVPVFRDLFIKRTDCPDPRATFVLPRLSDEKNPALPDDIKGRRFDVDGWQEFFVKTKLIQEKTESAAGDILRALRKYEPALQQLRDASPRPKCKFQTHWEDGAGAHLPHLVAALHAVRLFTMNAQAHLGIGSSPAARAEVEQAFRIHTALSSEPSLIAGLVRISILAVIERVVWDGLAGGQWPDEDLHAIDPSQSGDSQADWIWHMPGGSGAR